MELKRGLAGFVEADRPAWQKALVVTFLFPFWATSALRQQPWHLALRGLAIGWVWLVLLTIVAAASGPPADEVRLETRERDAATPTTTVTPEPTTTPATTPDPSPDDGTESAVGGDPLDVPLDVPDPGLGTVAEDTALDRLERLTVADEGPRTGYDRDLFPHWIDVDGDGCDTRREVLIAEAVAAPSVGSGCSFSGGRWYSSFDGDTTTNSSSFDVDHFVPLAEAWDSGASGWTPSRREAFANDLGYAGSLIAVSASSNRSKGDRDPAEWTPPLSSYHCTYASVWIEVKHRWSLTADQAEVNALASMLNDCDGSSGATSAPTSTPQPTVAPTQAPAPTSSGDCHPSYPDFCIPPPPPDLNCDDFTQKNFTVRHDVPDPDPHRLDGDKDGRACET